jgi:hypothetical protein
VERFYSKRHSRCGDCDRKGLPDEIQALLACRSMPSGELNPTTCLPNPDSGTSTPYTMDVHCCILSFSANTFGMRPLSSCEGRTLLVEKSRLSHISSSHSAAAAAAVVAQLSRTLATTQPGGMIFYAGADMGQQFCNWSSSQPNFWMDRNS